MAVIRLDRFEAEEGDLPAVCMKCGAPAVLEKLKQFSWNPPWVILLILIGLLPYVIVALVLTKRMRVRVPLCNEHKNHFAWRAWFIYGGFAGLFLLGIVVFAVMTSLDNGPGRQSDAVSGWLTDFAGTLFGVHARG